MRKSILKYGVGLGLGIVLLAAVACGKDLQPQVDRLEAEKAALTEQNQLLKDIAGPLPASLDNLHPPKAPAPVWLLEMLALEGPAIGIMIDLQQQDVPGAQANYQAFKAQYEKMSGMVPEWTDRFPTAPVEALGQALASGDPAKVGAAFGQVGEVCASCHSLFLVKAHQKYFWPDFRIVRVTDPLSKEGIAWVEYMQRMGGAFLGVTNDLQQGQLDNARGNLQAFSAYFKALPTNGCVICHATPRTYFVSPDIQAMVDQVGQALAAPIPDGKTVGDLFNAIGNESCMKCHLVHMPSVDTKRRWDTFADLFK